jgi:hypothetical protein
VPPEPPALPARPPVPLGVPEPDEQAATSEAHAHAHAKDKRRVRFSFTNTSIVQNEAKLPEVPGRIGPLIIRAPPGG